MSKKVLIISSSPRKGGNSDTLCDAFLKGALEAGHQAEKVFLKEKEIGYCTGCGYCINNRGKCSQKDDMVGIAKQMCEADVIVFATPIYFYTMCGPLKTFIDRNCFFYEGVANKDFYYIMTAADGNKAAMDKTMTEFDGFLDCLHNPTIKDSVIATGVWGKGDIQGSKFIDEAYQMGRRV